MLLVSLDDLLGPESVENVGGAAVFDDLVIDDTVDVHACKRQFLSCRLYSQPFAEMRSFSDDLRDDKVFVDMLADDADLQVGIGLPDVDDMLSHSFHADREVRFAASRRAIGGDIFVYFIDQVI